MAPRAIAGCLLAALFSVAGCAASDAGSSGAGGGAGTSSPGTAGSGGSAATTGGGGSAGTSGAAGTTGTGGSSAGTGGNTAGTGGGATGTGGAAGSAGGSAGAGGTAAAGGRGGGAGAGTAGGGGTAGSAGSAGRGGAAGSSAGGSGPPPGPCMPPTAYRNLFGEVLGKAQTDVDTKLNNAFMSLFHGGSNNTVYYESGTDEAYILDVASNDVRTEGLSYGMMIAVQMNKQTEFNKLWKWTKSHLQMSNGYFSWQANTSGQVIGPYSAPDGEEYYAPALIFASKRWGDGTGIYNYGAEARTLLNALANNGNFNRSNFLVGFGTNSNHTDASYVLPAFYEVWACFDTANASFWRSAVTAARAFFPKACNATTMLAPKESNWDGTPYSGSIFQTDAWRVVGNIMMDWNLYRADPWQANTFAPAYAAFFRAHPTGDAFTLSGTAQNTSVSRALQAQNALLGFALPAPDARAFVQTLWDIPIPSGQYRYFDGMLYMLSFLHASGNFRLWF